MSSPVYCITDARPADYESFIDGDKLIMKLPAVIDETAYDTVSREIAGAGHDCVRQILFDCTGVGELTAGGSEAFLRLGRHARSLDIRILVLDAPLAVSEQLDKLLPRATWVDSCQQADTALTLH